MQNEYNELLSIWKEYKEYGNDHGILFICDRLAELFETIENKPATEIYDTAYESLSKINRVAIGLNDNEYSRMRNYYKALSNNALIVRESEMVGEELIKDFIRPGDCRLLFDRQDLQQILYKYRQLGYVDIEGTLYFKLDYIVDCCLRKLQKESTDILALNLIKAGDKVGIMDSMRESDLPKQGVQSLYALNNTLKQSVSIRIYFFDKTTEPENTIWLDKINKAVEEVRSSTKF